MAVLLWDGQKNTQIAVSHVSHQVPQVHLDSSPSSLNLGHSWAFTSHFTRTHSNSLFVTPAQKRELAKRKAENEKRKLAARAPNLRSDRCVCLFSFFPPPSLSLSLSLSLPVLTAFHRKIIMSWCHGRSFEKDGTSFAPLFLNPCSSVQGLDPLPDARSPVQISDGAECWKIVTTTLKSLLLNAPEEWKKECLRLKILTEMIRQLLDSTIRCLWKSLRWLSCLSWHVLTHPMTAMGCKWLQYIWWHRAKTFKSWGLGRMLQRRRCQGRLRSGEKKVWTLSARRSEWKLHRSGDGTRMQQLFLGTNFWGRKTETEKDDFWCFVRNTF